jgi:hypothetical protein
VSFLSCEKSAVFCLSREEHLLLRLGNLYGKYVYD